MARNTRRPTAPQAIKTFYFPVDEEHITIWQYFLSDIVKPRHESIGGMIRRLIFKGIQSIINKKQSDGEELSEKDKEILMLVQNALEAETKS